MTEKYIELRLMVTDVDITGIHESKIFEHVIDEFERNAEAVGTLRFGPFTDDQINDEMKEASFQCSAFKSEWHPFGRAKHNYVHVERRAAYLIDGDSEECFDISPFDFKVEIRLYGDFHQYFSTMAAVSFDTLTSAIECVNQVSDSDNWLTKILMAIADEYDVEAELIYPPAYGDNTAEATDYVTFIKKAVKWAEDCGYADV